MGSTSTTSAIVVGAGLNGLGVVRSLGANGIPVVIVERSPGGPACNSRYASPRLYEPPASTAENDYLGFVLQIARRFNEPPTLFLTQEAVVSDVSLQRDRLNGHVRQVLADHAVLAGLMDKAAFQVRAQSLGFPVPSSVILQNPDDVGPARSLTFPCVLKPVAKSERWEQQNKKAYRFETFAELDAAYPKLQVAGIPVIVQEWIEGGDADVYFTLVYRDAKQATKASFTGRKLRQWPPLVGGTASCMPAPHQHDELSELTTRFFDAVGFVGMGSMEFKRDARTSRFLMVEPTVGRTDYQEEVATLNGVNIPFIAHCSLTGDVAPLMKAPRRPRIWRDAVGEKHSIAASKVGSPEATMSERGVDALFRTADPGPWLNEIWNRCASKLQRLVGTSHALPSLSVPEPRASVVLSPETDSVSNVLANDSDSSLIQSSTESEQPMMPMRSTLRRVRDAVTLPSTAKEARDLDRRGLPTNDPGSQRVIECGIDWLCRSQDMSKTQDGGFARDFSLLNGWASSYPETSGYIVPTIIEAAKRRGSNDLLARARRCLDWLVAIQFPEGGFQGGMVDQMPRVPVTFNTGQILLGLAAGAAHVDRAAYLEPMRKAAQWLADTQDEDGCWRRFSTPFAQAGEKTYETHVAWGLFEAARLLPDHGFGEAGMRQVTWALTNQQPNGWFRSNGLEDNEKPLTHTIGYALRGLMEAFRWSGQRSIFDAARKTADGVLGVIEPNGFLSGRLDCNWAPRTDWSCLTGSAQIAHSLFLLGAVTQGQPYAAKARLLTSYVRRTVHMGRDPNLRGGVKGSFPIDQEYGRYQYLNWACKFTVDALWAELDDTARSNKSTVAATDASASPN